MHELKHLIVVVPGVILDSVKCQRMRCAAAALIQRRDKAGLVLHLLHLVSRAHRSPPSLTIVTPKPLYVGRVNMHFSGASFLPRSEQDPELIHVWQQGGYVAIDAECARMVQLLFAVAASQDADAQHAGPPGCDVIPDGVADDDAGVRLGAEPFPARQKQVRLGLALQLPLSL